MTWDRSTVKAVAITFVVLVVTSFFLRWTSDHDGETITLGRDDPAPSATAAPPLPTGDTDPESGLPWVLETDLPPEARGTLALIDQGGPFPFPGKDGSTFRNLEGLLPDRPRGYYAEYTVVTPGSTDRGPRRIIGGDGGELYWTQDHYASFERIWRSP